MKIILNLLVGINKMCTFVERNVKKLYNTCCELPNYPLVALNN